MQKREIMRLKNSSHGKNSYFEISLQFYQFLTKEWHNCTKQLSSTRKVYILTVCWNKLKIITICYKIMYLCKNRAFKIHQPRENIMFQHLFLNFANLLIYFIQHKHNKNLLSANRSLSRGKIESVFGHFTKFSIRKTDPSQNSGLEKQTRHKIQIQKKTDSSQNSGLEKRTLHKIQDQKNGLFTKFRIKKTDSSKNSGLEKQTLHKIQDQKNRLVTKFRIRKTDSS